ncbi:MAG: hypothetical protein WC629_00990 [Candidatus Paceibacterota bacterium]|jgi:hypothetical protein
MDEDIKALLEKNLELAEENNHILRGIRRSNRISMIWSILYLLFIIGGGIVAFNYFKPYLIKAEDAYNSVVTTQNQIKSGIKNFLPK